MTRSRNLCDDSIRRLALVAFAVTGCGSGAVAPRFATTTEHPDQPRRPPGVAADPAPELPRAETESSTDRGLTVLRAPASAEAAREKVRDFFRAVGTGSYAQLEDVVGEDAWLQAGAMVGRQRARIFWQTRLSRLDYVALGGAPYRESEIETYRAADLPRLRPARPVGMVAQGEDVVIRVPIANPRSGKMRLFGDEILFLLRPKGASFAIVEMAEDFQLP